MAAGAAPVSAEQRGAQFNVFSVTPRVTVTALDTGVSFRGGKLAPNLLARSFGGAG